MEMSAYDPKDIEKEEEKIICAMTLSNIKKPAQKYLDESKWLI
jgi:hypothetical protein